MSPTQEITRYRIVSYNGINQWLEYLDVTNHHFLFLKWSTKRWLAILFVLGASPYPYSTEAEAESNDLFRFVSDTTHDLKQFVANYPDVAAFHALMYEMSDAREARRLEEKKLIERNKSTIIYL